MLIGKRSSYRLGGESGTTLVLMSLLLVALMGMSALVLDLGNARRVKRSAQGTSDSASLAAAQELGEADLTAAQRMAGAAAEAQAYAQRNLPAPTGGWPAAWTACTDPVASHPDTPIASTISPCISFDNSTIPTRVRVKVPTQQVQVQFARAIGQGAPISVNAGATASLSLDSPMGGMLFPFGHGPKSGTRRRFFAGFLRERPPLVGLDRIYDKSNSWIGGCRRINDNSADACVIRSPRLSPSGITEPQTLTINLGMGIDHAMASYKDGQRICDGPIINPCNIGTTPPYAVAANHVRTLADSNWWGSSETEWKRALAKGLGSGDTIAGTQYCGRLQRPQMTDSNALLATPNGCTSPAGPTINIFSDHPTSLNVRATVNGRHISYYMTDEARNAFYGPNGSCAYADVPEFETDPVWVGTSGPPSSYEYRIGDTRLHEYLKSGTIPCGSSSPFFSWLGRWLKWFNAPPASVPDIIPEVGTPLFEKEILLDPRFGWFPVITGHCPNVILLWCFGGVTGNFWLSEDRGKEIIEFRAAFIDWIDEDTYSSWFGTDYVDEVRAWTFDAALIEGGAPPVGPIRVSDGRGVPGTPVLSN